jgi:hypothetical protein
MNENNLIRRKTIKEMYSYLYFFLKSIELKEQGIDIEKLSFEEAIKYVYPEIEIENDFHKSLIKDIIEYMKKGGKI